MCFTVSLTPRRSTIRRAVTGLCFAFAQLEEVCVSQRRSTGVSHTLLLSDSAHCHVHRVPWRPGCESTYLGTCVQIARPVLLHENRYFGQIVITIFHRHSRTSLLREWSWAQDLVIRKLVILVCVVLSQIGQHGSENDVRSCVSAQAVRLKSPKMSFEASIYVEIQILWIIKVYEYASNPTCPAFAYWNLIGLYMYVYVCIFVI